MRSRRRHRQPGSRGADAPEPARVRLIEQLRAELDEWTDELSAYSMALFVAHDFNPDFLSIDGCLDAGGQWNYERRACEGDRWKNSPQAPAPWN
jgi:hypothetical protein